MSLLHDPFDLTKTGQDMDNVRPFIAQNKIDAMVDVALSRPQYPAQKPKQLSIWKFSGLAAVACMALFMVFLSPNSATVFKQDEMSISQINPYEAEEFSELVMLETWDRY
jgi:hypothetical protein